MIVGKSNPLTIVASTLLILFSGCTDTVAEKLEIPDEVDVVMDGLTRFNQLPSTGDGLVSSFLMQVNSPWTLSCEDSWLVVSPSSGEADREYTITLTASENEARTSRQTTLVLSVSKGEGWTKDYTIVQKGPAGVDSHEDGFVFLDENFDWIREGWTSSQKYGIAAYAVGDETNSLPVSSINGADTHLSQSFVTYDDEMTFGRYDGYLVLGTESDAWSISSKFFGDIDNESKASVDLSFDAAVYASVDGVKDGGLVKISVLSDGEFVAASDAVKSISSDKKEVVLDLSSEDVFAWNKHHVIFKGLSNSSQINFGGGKACRMALDNVKAVRCDESIVSAPVKEPSAFEAEYELSLDLEDNAPGIPDDYCLCVRSNKAWVLESDSPWITFAKVANVNDDIVCASISENGLSANAPSSGAEYSGTVISLSMNNSSTRTGNIAMKIDGKVVKTIAICQDKVVAAQGDIARWTFTGLYYKTYAGTEPVLESEGYKIAKSWCTERYAESDVVKGGTLSAYTKNEKSSFTIAGTNRPCNALRFGQGSMGDYFLFTVKLVMVEKDNTIQFRNAGIAVTSKDYSPADWVEEYSFDGQTWITLKEFHLNETHYPIGKESSSHSLDCDIPVNETIVRGSLMIRVRVSSNNTATSTFTDGSADIAYIYSDPNIAVNASNRAVQCATYTDERDYLIFRVTK